MLNFEEALAIAKTKKTKINHCIEYSNAYCFEFDSGSSSMGGDSPIVIMKEDGEVLNMISYAVTPGKKILRDFKI